MKIKKLNIQNFRGIRDLTIDFTDSKGNALDLITIAGTNGSGKTSILEACLFILGKWSLMPKPAKGNVLNTTIGMDSFRLSAVTEADEKSYDVFIKDKQYTPTVKIASTEVAASLPHFTPVEFFPSWRAPKLVGPVSVTSGKKGRRPENTLENRLWNLKQYFIDLTARKGFSENEKEEKYYQTQEIEAFEKLNKIWHTLYPEKKEQIIAGISGKEIQSGFDLYLTGRDSMKIPIDSLSSGELEALTMLGRYITSSLNGGIVIIDEPELHLHPAWQRKIINALRDVLPETQLIIATHSPQIIGEVPAENLFLLKRTDNTTEVLRPCYSFGLDANRILEELLGVSERTGSVKTELNTLFEMISNNKLLNARDILCKLKEDLKEEPELIKAEALIRRKELLIK